MSEYHIQYLQHRYRENDDSFCSRRHEVFCEIIFLQHGIGEAKINGKVYFINSGDMIVINRRTEHSAVYRCSERNGKLIRFAVGIRGVDKLIGDGESPVVRIHKQETLNALFQILEEEYVARGIHWESVCSGVLKSLIALIGRHKEIQKEEQKENILQSEALAREIILYLKAHYCESLSLQSVADVFFISPYYLAHLMKKYLGIPMIKYVIRLRMGEAQNLLYDTDYPIKQIALMLGYQNVNYFNNIFEKNTGMSPGAYRKESRRLI